ncbi:hypothetical protein HQ545_03885 [Candidatus Woesearchaeota archaeon]|nr:hypothetical protein [Candidatus Woesearchaeota archaeon]
MPGQEGKESNSRQGKESNFSKTKNPIQECKNFNVKTTKNSYKESIV